MNFNIFPRSYWGLSLNKNVFNVINFANTKLEVRYAY